MEKSQNIKNMFIDAAFKSAENGYWGTTDLEKLSNDLKVDPSEAYKLFSGIESILDVYSDQINESVIKMLDRNELREVMPREALLEVLMCRLDLLKPRKKGLKVISEYSLYDPCALFYTLKRVKKSMNIMISESEVNTKGGSGLILTKSISFLWILTLKRWVNNKESDSPAIATLDKGLKKIEEMGLKFSRSSI